jgi:hypothetical protein
MPLISQDKTYHDFADNITRYGIPRFGDVVTNIPFFFIGLYGLTVVKRLDHRFLFLGFMLTAFGSGYYHWNPNNYSLVYDRLGMSIALMGLFCAVCADYGVKWAKLYPFMFFGIVSVLYWAKFDELVPYAIMQFGSIFYSVFLLLMKKNPYETRLYLFLAYGSYAVVESCRKGR